MDIKAFSSIVKDFRSEFENCVDAGIYQPSDYRGELAAAITVKRHLFQAAPPRTAADLRSELRCAAMAAQGRGASDVQIEKIVALAVAQNDYRGLCYGLLTSNEALNIIAAMGR